MTLSASTILHRLCGSPRVAECVDIAGQCWHCGAHYERAQAITDWMGANFVGQNRILGGAHLTHVCEPCMWVMSRSPGVVPGAPPTHNWRLYTVLVHGNEVWRGNKANKPEILAWLRAPKTAPWFAAIADSGQKHVVPYAPINPGPRGVVQFEEERVRIGDWQMVDDTIALLTAGATKDSIASGAYTPGEWQRCGDVLRAFEERWAQRYRGGPWFKLGLWLAQRDEEAVQARMAEEKAAREAKAKEAKANGKGKRRDEGGVARGDGARAARSEGGVPRGGGLSAPPLGSTPRPDAGGGAHVVERGGVARDDAAPTATRGTEQLGLF